MEAVPQPLEELLTDTELENAENLTGWATGTVGEVDKHGNTVAEFEGAWIELLNGNGSGRAAGGVRFYHVHDDDVASDQSDSVPAGDGFTEAFAFGSKGATTEGWPPFYFVKNYEQDIDIDQPAPKSV
jgi:hypothetical protein